MTGDKMENGKSWKEMLADVQAELAAERERASAETKRADTWVLRLHNVFNSEAANRITPRISKKARQEYAEMTGQGIALANEITGKILKNELSVAELNMIAAHARDITPVDGLMFGLLQPVAFAANVALENAIEAGSAALNARDRALEAQELAVFKAYLRENPESARLIAAMMTDDGSIRSVSEIARRNPGITWQQLQAVVDEVEPILTNSFSLSPFTVSKMLKREFEDMPKDQRQDEHYTRHYGFSRKNEVRDAVKAAVQKP